MKASVIIPAWGDTPYLAEVRRCLSAQTMPDFEIIVSAPPVGEENAGAARNAGLARAKGKWIFFVDADDMPAPNCLEAAIAVGERTEVDVVAFRADEVDAHTGIRVPMPYLNRLVPWADGRVHRLNELGSARFTTLGLMPWNKAVRRDFLVRHNVRFQSIRRADDVAYSVELCSQAETFAALDVALIGYRVNNAGSQEATSAETPLNFYAALLETKRRLGGQFDAALNALAKEMFAYHLHSVRNLAAYRQMLAHLSRHAAADFGIDVPHTTAKGRNALCFWIGRSWETLRDRGIMFCLRRLFGRVHLRWP